MLGFLSVLPNKVQRETEGKRTGYGSINNYAPTTSLWVLKAIQFEIAMRRKPNSFRERSFVAILLSLPKKHLYSPIIRPDAIPCYGVRYHGVIL
jgi:hypothetical protein